MPGRTTHKYPRGKPVPLVLVDTAMLGVLVLWVIFAHAWLLAAGIAILFFSIVMVRSIMIERYERRGLAIPIGRHTRELTFPKGLPAPMRFLRYSAVLALVVLLFFGYALWQG